MSSLARESVLQRRLSLSDMLDVGSFQEVVKGFVELYRIGIKVFDEKGAKLADIKIGNGDFCGYVFSFPTGRQRCTQWVGRVKDGPVATTHGARNPELGDEPMPKGLVTAPCFTGLRYLILPITFEADVLGRIIFGPFLPEEMKQFPPTLIEWATTIPDREITAISVVPPPTSQIALARGSEIRRPAPIAAASGSSISQAWRAPAEMAASVTARRSTEVTPDGTQIMISGLKMRGRPCTLPMKW